MICWRSWIRSGQRFSEIESPCRDRDILTTPTQDFVLG